MAESNHHHDSVQSGSELDRLLEASVHRIGNEPEDPSSMGSYDEVAEEDTDRVGDPDHSDDGTVKDHGVSDRDARTVEDVRRAPREGDTGLEDETRDLGADHDARGIRRDVDRDARLDERTDFLDAEERPTGGDLGSDEPRQ